MSSSSAFSQHVHDQVGFRVQQDEMAADESVLELLREPWQRFDEHWPRAPSGRPTGTAHGLQARHRRHD
jgi:hypothetical protein